MSERMTPIPFEKLMRRTLAEYDKYGSVFDVAAPYRVKDTKKALPLFDGRIETPFGPAAGPNTQLAQNIIAAYFAGARFFELKTVQKMDGAELAACIGRPCILANDEGYNCEWSTELTVPQAFEEYVKAWVALKLISKRFGLGCRDGFMFNISVGYDFEGIKTKKLDAFINGMKDASAAPIWAECIAAAKALFPDDADYIDCITPHICSGVTVSTLHGCPPSEIEAIASYLIETKHLNTFVKCNPTILGYEFARKTLDDMGYDYICFDEHHFNEDLQYEDAVPMFARLSALAQEHGLEFGLKLSNTFPVDVKANELPSEEMYMSGRALYPLTVEMANRIAREFDGKLRISYSGGADYFNIKGLFEAGIWPITVATTILKPGGYSRLSQLAELFVDVPFAPFGGVDCERIAALSTAARTDAHNAKPIKPLPKRKLDKAVPLMDCFTAPCKGGCPIGQDAPEYIELVGKGQYLDALKLIAQRNALPNITGAICAHRCMDKCTRSFYEAPVDIRACKLDAVQHAYVELLDSLKPLACDNPKKVAVIGAGPAGIAAAYFLARGGADVTVYEKSTKPGGIVREVIPEFRIENAAIDRDVALAEKLGANFVCGSPAPSFDELNASCDYILLATGAPGRGKLPIDGNVINVIDFLHAAKCKAETLPRAKSVAVIGGGNSAMDAARAAKRLSGVERVSLVYRRTKKYMPADAEELMLAIADGVEFCELLSPINQQDGKLLCERMALGEPDASGRRAPVGTGQHVEIPAELVVAAVGEHPDADALRAYGAEVDDKGHAAFNTGKVFVLGDALRGPATVVEGIADAMKAAYTICGEYTYDIPASAYPEYHKALLRKGRLNECGTPSEKCLACNTVCVCCATVCPNRANAIIDVPGYGKQILHIDYMCNECGNCATFCPYDSAPYKDKLTYFANECDFTDSTNPGFMLTGENKVRVRLDGSTAEYALDQPNPLDKGIEAFILAVIKDYPYIL